MNQRTQTMEAAWDVAARALRANIVKIPDATDADGEKHYLLAGAFQYRALWARDLAMASRGAMDIGEFKAVRDSLSAFFAFQREDGLLPRGIDNWNIFSRVILGVLRMPPSWGHPFKGWYVTENRVITVDGNLMIPWAASEYLKRSQDKEFAERWFAAAEKAVRFIEDHFLVNGLIGLQPPFSDWADSVRRWGHVAFTNEFYILALEGMADWAQFLGDRNRSLQYMEMAKSTVAKFKKFFWDPEKKMIRNFEDDHRWTADANFLAVVSRLIQDSEAIELMKELRQSPLYLPLPGRPTWPDYHPSSKSFLVKWVGLGNYHDNLHWLWISALAARAELVVGNREGYESILSHLAERIVADQEIHEVYEPSKNRKGWRPVQRWLYRAEAPFSWSAGCFIEAVAQGR